MRVTKTYRIEGLDCANCAAKVERSWNQLKELSSASIDFMGGKAHFEAETEEQLQAGIEQARRLMEKLEPGTTLSEVTRKTAARPARTPQESCGCGCGHNHEHDHNHEQEHHHGDCCGHDHKESAHDEACGCEHEEACGCGHDHSHAHKQTVQSTPSASVVHHGPGCHCAGDHCKFMEMEQVEEGNARAPKIKNRNLQSLIQILVSAVLMILATVLPLPQVVSVIVFVISYLIVGGEVVWRAVRNLFKGHVFDENFLMTVATVGAFAIGDFREGIAVMLFYQVGELFQSYAVNKSRKSITGLMNIRPDYANLQMGGEIQRVSPEEIVVGDTILVKTGEKIPLDGVILEGESFVDTSALTGESVPRKVTAGDDVLSGCINTQGLLTIRVTKEFGDSTVSKILDLVENASSKKANTENFITKFARYYTPLVVISAVLLAVIPPLVVPGAEFSDWIYRALTFLVISCPCALVISIPLSFFGGIGGASRAGVLVKGSNYLEALAKVDTVVFDKTGTLTKGVFRVTAMIPADGMTKEELLRLAALGESYSNHPIAQSIVKAYGKTPDQSFVGEYAEISGHGIRAEIEGKTVLLGNQKLLDSEGVAAVRPAHTGTIVYAAVDGVYAGALVISDEVKEDAAAAIEALHRVGVSKTVMLTGDTKEVGEQVAKQIGLDEVYTNLLPGDKVDQLERLLGTQSKEQKLAFVGDGINDAPVLARADVGIAMGGLGSDAAIEAADIVIMTDEPSKIAVAIRHARRTLRIVHQNIWFALGIKALFLVLGAFGVSSMWEAVFADVGVAVIAILNAIRALKVQEGK